MIKDLMVDIKSRNELRLVISQPGGWKTLNEYVSESTTSDFEKGKKLAEARALKKRCISIKTYHVLSSSAQWFWNAQENRISSSEGPRFYNILQSTTAIKAATSTIRKQQGKPKPV